MRARVARKIPSKVGQDELIRVQVGRVGTGWVAAPLQRGAGIITSLSRAHGLLTVPALLASHAAYVVGFTAGLTGRR